MSTILVFGDSIAMGAYDFEAGGWAGRLKAFLEKERSSLFSLYNLAVDGDTTTFLLERFESEVKDKAKEGAEMIIIFAMGTNDSYFIHSQNRFGTSLEEFKDNVKKLTELARKFSSEIVFVGLVPVDEPRITPMPWDTDKSYKNKDVERYDKALRETCRSENVHFIEIFNNWIKSDYKSLLEDGLHPNSQGHKRLFETIKDFLISKNII